MKVDNKRYPNEIKNEVEAALGCYRELADNAIHFVGECLHSILLC